jgi:hypothetical protein
MAHALIFWSGSPELAPAEVWERLYAGRPVAFVAELGAARVRAAFASELGPEVTFEEAMIYGPGFELEARDGARYLEVCFPTAPGAELLARVEAVGCGRLGCSLYHPASGRYREGARAPAPHEAPAPEQPASGFAPGARVRHAKFGQGEVVASEGDKVTVRFADGRERRLLGRFVHASQT